MNKGPGTAGTKVPPCNTVVPAVVNVNVSTLDTLRKLLSTEPALICNSSVPSPPLIESRIGSRIVPAPLASKLAPARITSLPSPAMIVSKPLPVSIVSLPAPEET